MNLSFPVAVALGVLSVLDTAATTFETETFLVLISPSGQISALRQGANDYLAADQPAPLLQLRVDGEWHQPDRMQWDASNRQMRLDYETAGIRAVLQAEAKPTHVVFELTALEPVGAVELILWGPYPTTIGETVGETVGVVRNVTAALGIQALNPKTLGGFPGSEDDVMPMYNIFAGGDYSDIAAEQRDHELYRGDTAKPTAFGSVLQAYCRDRSRERVIKNWAHSHFVAPAFEDGGVLGSRIALFGCPAEKALETIGRIELAEGLPHPLIDGVWGKIAPEATASYLIIDFGEGNLDTALELTGQAGLKYLYHGGPFRTWGHFELHPGSFPDGWASLKRCVERAQAAGIRLGVHTLSNFITPNDAYVTPVPDPRLASVGTTVLADPIDAVQTTIPVADPAWFNQMQNNTLKTARIDRELIRYGRVSEGPPWQLLECERGAWGTSASSHAAGQSIAKLMDHGYRVFLTDAELSWEVARRIAELFNRTGLLQVSFDGLEGAWSTGMGQYGRTLFTQAWYEHLSPELQGRVINDASNPGHFNWHVYTRMNWGEPWYAGFRESQTQYRLKNQNYYARNLMPRMLGWFQMNSETTLEDAEWLLARAAGFDAGFALVTNPEVARKNGAGASILAAIKHWEQARLAGWFPEELKAALRDIKNEFHLAWTNGTHGELYPVYSAKGVHDRREQPGMVTYTEFEIRNPHAAQPLQFILQVTGKTSVDGLVLEINGREAWTLTESLAPGQVLRYAGGDEARLCDAQGNTLKSLQLDPARLQVVSGPQHIRVGGRFQGGDAGGVKCEFRTVGRPHRIGPPSRHVVLLGIDGLRADSFVAANTPHLDGVMKDGAYTLEAVSSTGQATSSGPSWSSILTGVWTAKHGVRNNEFTGQRYAEFPSFLERVKDHLPGAFTASLVNWAPINQHIPNRADFERRGIKDAEVTEEAVRLIRDQGPHALFIQLDELDGAGHNGGFHPGNPAYLEKAAVVDGQVGAVLAAVAERKAAQPQEAWLVIIVSDHGGTPDGKHGGQSPEEVIVPYLMVGDDVVGGPLAPTVYNVDAPVTALAWLGIQFDPAWDLDGQPRGLAIPEAAATAVR